jgi:2-oxoglutarate ferredoxin oxidoreductase subunit beta
MNTYAWYNERVYMLDENYDSSDKSLAIKKATEFGDKIPIGIIFKEEKPSFHEKNSVLKDSKPLLDRKYDQTVVNRLFKELI